jgi:hypothetical protein
MMPVAPLTSCVSCVGGCYCINILQLALLAHDKLHVREEFGAKPASGEGAQNLSGVLLEAGLDPEQDDTLQKGRLEVVLC